MKSEISSNSTPSIKKKVRLLGFALSALFVWTTLTLAHAQPQIVRHPTNRSIRDGGNYAMRVSATGMEPLQYQWFFNGLPVVGATDFTLPLNKVGRAAAGEYYAVVTDATGSATSRVARLSVYIRTGIFDIADPVEFDKILSVDAEVTTMATVNSWIEGVVWVPSDGGFLVFSDIGNNRLKKLVPPSTLTDFLTPPPNTRFNGNLLDLHERLISCQAGRAALRVVVTTDGVPVPLITEYTDGSKFYSPNDLAIKSDGSIWFTDPGYDSGLPLPPPVGSSIPSGYQPGLHVYRFFQNNGNDTVLSVVTDMIRPNGICLSPDESKLYVADSASAPGPIRVYDITSTNTVTGGSVFATIASGVPDGIKCDIDGRVWSSAGDGVEIFAPDGHWIGTIRMTRTANLCFGGPSYQTLYMVGQPNVSSIPVRVPGAVAIKRLAASRQGNEIKLKWPAPSTGFVLQETSLPSDPGTWADVATPPSVSDESNVVTVETSHPASYFRLRLP